MGLHDGEVDPPSGNHRTNMAHRKEQAPIVAFIPCPTLKALSKGILGRLAGGDIAPVELLFLRESGRRLRGEFILAV